MSDFIETLTRLEYEVRDLKTAHRRPLGTIDFFQKNIQISLSQFEQSFGAWYGHVVMKSLSGAPIPTYCAVACRVLNLNGPQTLLNGFKYNDDMTQCTFNLIIDETQVLGVSNSSIMSFTATAGGPVSLTFGAGNV